MTTMGISAGTAFINILPNMTGFAAGMTAGMAGLSTKLKSVGMSLTKSLTLPIALAGAASVKLAMDFETSMQHIVGLVGISQKQVDKWGDQIIEMGPKLGIGPRELAEALYFVTSSGVDASKAMEILRVSAKGAAAGLGQTQVVADTLTSVINAYGEENIDAATALDVLTSAVKAGKAEASSFAPVLGSILPTASELKVEFWEVAAAVAAMTRNGDTAALAATKVNAVFNQLVKTSKGQEAAFKAAGFSAEELRKSLDEKGLLPTLNMMRDAVDGNISKLAEFFPNVRALRGMLALTGVSAEKVAGVFDDVSDSVGEGGNAFKVAAQTTQFAWNSAKAALEGAAISFGQILLPLFADFANALQTVAQWFAALDPTTQKWIIGLLAVAAAIGPIIAIIGVLIGAITSGLLPVFALIAGAAVLIISNWEKIEPVVMPVVDAIKEGAIQVFNSIKYFAQDFWAWLQGFFAGVNWRAVAQGFVSGLKWIADAFSWLVEQISNAFFAVLDLFAWVVNKIDWSALWETTKTVWGNISDFLVGIWTWISDRATEIWRGISDVVHGIDWGSLWDGVMRATKATWEGIYAFLISFWNQLKARWIAIWNAIGEIIAVIDWDRVWQATKATWNAIFDLVSGVVKRLLDVWNWFQDGVTKIINDIDWGKVASDIFTAIGKAIQWLKDAGKAIGKWAKEMWDDLAPVREFIIDIAKAVWENLGDAWKQLVAVVEEDVMPALRMLWEALENLWDPLLKGIVGILGIAIGGFLKLASALLGPIIDAIGKVIHFVAWLISILAKAVQSVVKFVAGFISGIVKFVQGVASGIGKVIQFFKELPGKIWDFIKSIPGKLGDIFKTGVENALNWLGGILNWFKELPGNIWNFIKQLPGKFGEMMKNLVNTAITWWNKFDLKIHLRAPNVKNVIGLDGQTIWKVDDLIPDIPLLAEGGIVFEPTMAIMGEAGAEAIVPLDKLMQMIQTPQEQDATRKEVEVTNAKEIAKWIVRALPASRLNAEGMSY